MGFYDNFNKIRKNIVGIFNQFSDPDIDPSFHKTMISVKLMQFEGQKLMSRSQARRLLARVDHFKEAVLDFEDVVIIGQAFADEIFRVFQNEHPEIKLIPVNMHPDVERMIRHVKIASNFQSSSIKSYVIIRCKG